METGSIPGPHSRVMTARVGWTAATTVTPATTPTFRLMAPTDPMLRFGLQEVSSGGFITLTTEWNTDMKKLALTSAALLAALSLAPVSAYARGGGGGGGGHGGMGGGFGGGGGLGGGFHGAGLAGSGFRGASIGSGAIAGRSTAGLSLGPGSGLRGGATGGAIAGRGLAGPSLAPGSGLRGGATSRAIAGSSTAGPTRRELSALYWMNEACAMGQGYRDPAGYCGSSGQTVPRPTGAGPMASSGLTAPRPTGAGYMASSGLTAPAKMIDPNETNNAAMNGICTGC